MAKLTTDQMLEAVSEMTVLELSEFVKAFEEKFGVSAAAPVAVAAAPAAEVRGAILGTSILDLAQLTALSKLPSREVLLATVAGAFQAPVQKLAFLFNAPLQKLGYALGGLKTKRESEGA